MATAQPILELDGVCTSYGTVPMLQNVNLTVNEGELVCLLGPNGAGKSTSFNTMVGLLRADSGKVRILGKDVDEVGAEALLSLGVGLVPEGRRLFPSLTVRQNLFLGFKAAARGDLDFNERLAGMGTLFPRIAERLNQTAVTMSGGEQAMVALARSLIGDPKLIVMDEPSLGLSPKLIDDYFDIVTKVREMGKTVLLIEQNAETALRVTDRGYLLVRGEIAAEGKSSDLLEDDIVHHLYF